MKYKVSGVTHVGNIRSTNQDNYYCDGKYRELDQDISYFDQVHEEEKWIAAVFDGMGGEKDGEIASLLAGKITAEYCSGSGDQEDIGALIGRINEAVCEEMDERKSRMGSTCVFLEFDGNRCRSWNIGDSRAYFFSNGSLTQLTEDHTEAASYTSIFGKESSAKHGSENRLTQHLGIPEDDFIIEPFTSEWMDVQSGDILLICSDGLSHMVGDESIAEVLGSDFSAEYKRSQLLDFALGKGGQDNITIILITAGL